MRDMSKISTELSDMGERREHFYKKAMDKILVMGKSVEELKERTWELDSSTHDNLVFYGIKENSMSDKLELVVKEVMEDVLKRNNTVDNLAGDPLQAEHTARHALCKCSEKYGDTWHWGQASHRAV